MKTVVVLLSLCMLVVSGCSQQRATRGHRKPPKEKDCKCGPNFSSATPPLPPHIS